MFVTTPTHISGALLLIHVILMVWNDGGGVAMTTVRLRQLIFEL